MRRLAALLLFMPISTSTFAQDLVSHGNFRHMMHTGNTQGTVALDTLEAPDGWGVGALEDLKGEVVILDGRVLVSRGNDHHAHLTPPQSGEKAAILAYGQVTEWQSQILPHPMTQKQLEQFLGHQVAKSGLDPDAGFPFRLQGQFDTLIWHVVTGEAPAHGQGGGHGHGGGHENSRSGMIKYDEAGSSGEVVGIYTGTSLEGIASHPGEKTHLHFVSEDGTRSGHVDEITFPSGTTLLLPVTRSQ